MVSRDEQQTDALARLVDLAIERSALRVTTGTGGTVVEGPGGTERLSLALGGGHDEALSALPAGVQRLADGSTLAQLGDVCVLTRPADPALGVEALAREGWLSELAARLLAAALRLRRNVLVVGPWSTAVPLITSLVGEGVRPAHVGSDDEACPVAWASFSQIGDALAYVADRVGVWSHDVR